MSMEKILSGSFDTGFTNVLSKFELEENINWNFVKDDNGVMIYTNALQQKTMDNESQKQKIYIKLINYSNKNKRIFLDIHQVYNLNNENKEDIGYLEVEINGSSEDSSKNAVIRFMKKIGLHFEKRNTQSFIKEIQVMNF